MDEQTRRNLRRAYNGLLDMDTGISETNLETALRFYVVAMDACRSYPGNVLASIRERKMNAMLDRVTRRLDSQHTF